MKDVIQRLDVGPSIGCRGRSLALALAALAACGAVQAAQNDASQLGTKLTPLGAEVAASADGVIPAWATPGKQDTGWSYGQVRGQSWKFKDDKPLYSITAANVAQYAKQLSPGQLELFKKIPDYRMDVYPTRRTCGAPDFVVDNTRKNVGFATLDADGVALQDAHVPGIPFPMPTTGAEVMWNMKMRYRGVGFDMAKTVSGISPRPGGGSWLQTSTDWFMYTPWGQKGSALFSSFDRLEVATYFSYNEPAALAGQAGVVTTKAGEQASTFYYFPGQRRVRRMPSYSYDSPQIGLDNQYTIDESNIFFGPMDRFDWKLVGKQELLVPYNSFGAYDASARIEDVAQQNAFAPQYRRYELHRVWVVEATVRQGMRHQAPKRMFYIDEDSWNGLVAVDYDKQGQIWKVREGYPIPVYETGTCDMEAQVQYNLVDGRYLYDMTSIGVGKKDHRWLTEDAGNPRLKRDFYTSDNLRAISER
ncbi:MAG: DUF1329 domain-containing protein [Pseudomonas asiatica]|uniref:DUF1329 domain-containing protein n=1 Tax=Pseudomonas shirazica TaxID=1940636 RepID=A0ABY9SUY1_9PSED|nr:MULTISPECIES: DUF1329 domain-containing protein [Pseudomonas]MCO8260024.1 DUF1329 domain-containing protein [Pseudomonas asiatica]WMY87407.1 DUF1329 domain-containing protein [Pseudomonas shirazica]